MLLFSKCRACAAFLLVSQAGERSLALLVPGSQSGKASMEAVMAEPQEDGVCCHHPLCQGGLFGHRLYQGNTLVKKALAVSSLL